MLQCAAHRWQKVKTSVLVTPTAPKFAWHALSSGWIKASTVGLKPGSPGWNGKTGEAVVGYTWGSWITSSARAGAR